MRIILRSAASITMICAFLCLSGGVSLAEIVPPICDSCPCLPNQPIGLATMLPDGTIYLDLVACSEDKDFPAIGHARLVFLPTDPKYKSILEHIGTMNPGEKKPVYPWP